MKKAFKLLKFTARLRTTLHQILRLLGKVEDRQGRTEKMDWFEKNDWYGGVVRHLLTCLNVDNFIFVLHCQVEC